MKKYTIPVLGLFAVAGLLLSAPANAQIMFNNGAEVYVTTGAIVQVNGGLQNDNLVGGPGIIDNEGDIKVTTLPGAGFIWLTNGSVTQGNGKYHLDNNWINDATFTCNNSTVEMYGNTAQYITSNTATITTFDTLTATGVGAYGTINSRKIQTLDANVAAALILNDRTLWTESNIMHILTPNVSAVTNNPTHGSEGFVRSETTGRLSRVTNSVASYFYPVGSDTGAMLRYRPVYMTPQGANKDTFNIRLANYDASKDGDSTKLFDSTLCTVNPLFFHQIDRTKGSVDNSDIDVYYYQPNDGGWSGLAQWGTPKVGMYNNMGVVTASAAYYNDNLKTNWGNFTKDPYILANAIPGPPVLNCSGLCANADGSFTVTGTGSSYTWTTPAGTTILNGQGTDSITVQWNGTPGNITVVANSAGCASAPASCNVTVSPSPTAGYDTVSTGLYNTTWGFTDTSKSNITSWAWSFGDGGTSNSQDPTHYYSAAGTYVIIETVTNSSGCRSSKADTIIIPEEFNMPNVFTPNGDGKNDYLQIQCSGVSSFSLQIYNRWGEEMFSTNNVNIAWDGRTNAGVKASDGTYYYVLKATSTSGTNWDRNGFITILGSGSTGN